MCKAVFILTICLVLLASGYAENIRRKAPSRTKRGGRAKGVKGSDPSITQLGQTVRRLKKGKKRGYYYHEDEHDDDDYYSVSKKYKKKRGKKWRKSSYYEPEPECRTVVEPAEFVMHNALTMVVPGGNSTSAAAETTIGTQYIFQGPLMDDSLEELQDYYVSGVCTRTWYAQQGIPGAAMCTMTFTIATGASISAAGEVFDAWINNVGINGGTFEMEGVSGQATLVAVDGDLNEYNGDFFSSEYIHGRVALVYHICEEGYWEDRIADGPEDLEGATYPDPFDLASSD